MFNRIKAAADFIKEILSPEEVENLSDPTLINLAKSFDADDISSFFQDTTFEFIEDLEKGRRPTVPVGTVRGNFIKTADGWKYHSKENRVKEGHSAPTASKPQSKELNWSKLGPDERKRRIEIAERKMAEHEKEGKKEEANALRFWLERHKLDAETHQKVEKGGPGSGQKGHHTDRKPYPGEEAYKWNQNLGNGADQKKTPKGMMGPDDIPQPHYSDPPMMKKYRDLIKKLGPEMVQGRFHYDHVSDKIVATDEGKMLAQAAAGLHKQTMPGKKK